MTPARWSLTTRRTAAARVNRDPGRCESVLADADRHQPHSLGSSPRRTLTCTPSAPRKSSSGPHSGQRRSSGIAARGCGTRGARPGTARSPAGSSLTTVLEATSPGRSRSAGPKTPVESPCRYRIGITSVTFGHRRPASVDRQDPRQTACASPSPVDALVVDPRSADRHRPRADRPPPLPPATVADHQPLALLIDLLGTSDVLLGLRLERRGDRPTRALPREIIQCDPTFFVLPDGEPANM
jgi:hypothetical protein